MSTYVNTFRVQMRSALKINLVWIRLPSDYHMFNCAALPLKNTESPTFQYFVVIIELRVHCSNKPIQKPCWPAHWAPVASLFLVSAGWFQSRVSWSYTKPSTSIKHLFVCFFPDTEMVKMKKVLESLTSVNNEKVQCNVTMWLLIYWKLSSL